MVVPPGGSLYVGNRYYWSENKAPGKLWNRVKRLLELGQIFRNSGPVAPGRPCLAIATPVGETLSGRPCVGDPATPSVLLQPPLFWLGCYCNSKAELDATTTRLLLSGATATARNRLGRYCNWGCLEMGATPTSFDATATVWMLLRPCVLRLGII